MNSGTLAGSLIFAAVLVMLIAVLARLMSCASTTAVTAW